MRKSIFILTTLLIIFSSCSNSTELHHDFVSITLPHWPPTSTYQNKYPELSRWQITLRTSSGQTILYYNGSTPTTASGITITKNQITLHLQQNKPASLIVQPITKNTNEKETLFFKPAGFLYPYSKKLTWEQGFLATVMKDIYNNPGQNSQEKVSTFLSTFNWQKAEEIIENKLKTEPYNPWLLNKSNICKKICEKKFSAIYLNLSKVEKIKIPTETGILLDSFIPNNFVKMETLEKHENNIILKESLPTLFLNTPSTGIIITEDYSKKLLLEQTILPIFIEGL